MKELAPDLGHNPGYRCYDSNLKGLKGLEPKDQRHWNCYQQTLEEIFQPIESVGGCNIKRLIAVVQLMLFPKP